MLRLKDIEDETNRLLADVPEGAGLDPLASVLIALAVRASVVALRPDEIAKAIADARAVGASTAQIQEIINLVSGLGVHSLMVSATLVLNSDPAPPPIDSEREELWARYVRDDPYWKAFDAELPGFLEALLRISPSAFRGFFDYCAIPWESRHVRAVTKELAAMACDASPGHRFGPGFRLHLRNAVKLGAGKKAVLDSLKIAAATPEHIGVS
ncbi:MAG: carboxymuconolactone decarboxylase family protein [Novosphingobium sp.]